MALINVRTVVVAKDAEGKCYKKGEITTPEKLAQQIVYMVRTINNVANTLNYAYDKQIDVYGVHYISPDQKLQAQKDLDRAYNPLFWYAEGIYNIGEKEKELAEYIFSLGNIIKIVDELEVQKLTPWYESVLLALDSVIGGVKKVYKNTPGLPEFGLNLIGFLKKALTYGFWGGLGYITYRVSADIIVPLVRKD